MLKLLWLIRRVNLVLDHQTTISPPHQDINPAFRYGYFGLNARESLR